MGGGGQRPRALKAFLTVRVGDIGLLVGTAIMFGASGTFTIRGLHEWANEPATSHTVLLWAAVALFIACIGKSGQFPLHTWLPDAMAGPTPGQLAAALVDDGRRRRVPRRAPVSRSSTPASMINVAGQHFNLIAVIGGITILIAAGAGVRAERHQEGAGLLDGQPARLHDDGPRRRRMGAGRVPHLHARVLQVLPVLVRRLGRRTPARHHSFDMKKDMGGLRTQDADHVRHVDRRRPRRLCGVPFFSGFFSKDEIIDSAGHFHYAVFMIVGLIGAFMTTAYMTRATYLTFFGEPRGAAAHFVHGDRAPCTLTRHPATLTTRHDA